LKRSNSKFGCIFLVIGETVELDFFSNSNEYVIEGPISNIKPKLLCEARRYPKFKANVTALFLKSGSE
jgi:hypothetical protein